jgi:hypothetical protein
MKTDDLIDLLARDAAPPPGAGVPRRLAIACLLAVAGALALLLARWGLRPDLHDAMRTGPFWMKAGYTLWIAAAAFVMTAQAARPGGAPNRPARMALVAAVVVILGLAITDMVLTPAADRHAAWMGHSALWCPWRILAISVPAFAAIVWGLRSLAPTRLTLAGAAAGLLAGGIGATVYGLYCQETTAMFVASWYTLGLAGCAGIGALLGPRLLRW